MESKKVIADAVLEITSIEIMPTASIPPETPPKEARPIR